MRMPGRAALALLPLFIALAVPAASQDVLKKVVGQVTFTVDAGSAYPGGLFVARLQSRRAIGAAYATFEGRRAPFYSSPRGPRALVPIPVTSSSGDATLGVEILARRGRQRIPLEVEIAPRDYPPRTVVIPEGKRPLLKQPSVTRDGRELLGLLRTETPAAQGLGPLRPPITIVPGLGFGSAQTYVGGSPVEMMLDAIHGEYHRGLDYDVPVGTVVMAPAAGSVLFAGPLALSGQTLVLDHGQGVISVLFHLYRIDVRTGDPVEARATVGLSGETGLATSPQLQWRVYIHGVAVDPRALEKGTE